MSRNLPILAPNPPSPVSMVPAAFAQSSLSVEQILALLRAHLRQAILIFVVLVVATVIIIKQLPKSYTAQATVLVNFESNDGTRQAPPDMYTNYLLTQVALLQNREVLLAVIDRLGLTRDPEFTGGFKNDGVNTLRDWVEKNLRSNLGVEQGKGLQLLYVSATSKDRNKAAQIANTLVEVYEARESNHGDDASSGRAHEYSQQLTDLKAKVTAAEQQMAEFRQRTGITDIKEQNDVETQALAALEQQLLATQNLRRTAESKNTGDQGSSDPVMGSALIQNLKNQLSTLQAQLAQSTTTLGPKHPRVLELQSQIVAARHALDHEMQNFSQNSSTTVTSAAQLEGKLKRAVDDQRAKVVKIRQLQDEGQKLQLELDSAQTVYKRALDSYDQEMFASSSFVSRATPPLAPSKPNKMLLLAIGVLLSALVSVAGPLGHEIIFNRRLHCRDDIEREFGLPVLAELNRIPAEPRFT
ncbi:MAG TPA: Wzz/FepE/Etk N-terminal domain-containing protein [Steroidobacteraceae bacterium]|nr:Wzz/FepE/Etk N-terminal domain-containing protein [Steroidobacteraceae bacterium]